MHQRNRQKADSDRCRSCSPSRFRLQLHLPSWAVIHWSRESTDNTSNAGLAWLFGRSCFKPASLALFQHLHFAFTFKADHSSAPSFRHVFPSLLLFGGILDLALMICLRKPAQGHREHSNGAIGVSTSKSDDETAADAV